MKYMLLIYTDENAYTDGERQHCYVESTELTHDLNARGQFLAANPLQPVTTATSVRVRNGKRLVTDGPFAETREQLGGYFLVEATDLNEAIAIASRIPAPEGNGGSASGVRTGGLAEKARAGRGGKHAVAGLCEAGS